MSKKADLISMADNIIRNIMPKRGSWDESPRRRLFLSRAEWQNQRRSLINRSEVEDIFRLHGYEIVYPERLSIGEQIALYRSAAVLAGENGSALHNCLFGHPEQKVLVLKSRSDGVYIQSSICEQAGQQIAYCYGESYDRAGAGRHGPWIADPVHLRDAIEAIANF